jgi:hypothetical protein
LSLDALAPVVSWVMQQYRHEIQRGMEKSPRRFEDMLHRALWAGRPDLISTIWEELGPPSSRSSFDGFGRLHRLICRLAGEVHDRQINDIAAAVGRLLSHGYDAHRLGKERMYSQYWETPLSCAMYASGSFWHWRNILSINGIAVEDYAKAEMRRRSGLVDSGWTEQGLIRLFHAGLAPSFYNERSTCRRCKKNFFFSRDLWWYKVLKNAREARPTGTAVYDDSREWKDMDSWNRVVEADYFKGWVQIVKLRGGQSTAQAGTQIVEDNLGSKKSGKEPETEHAEHVENIDKVESGKPAPKGPLVTTEQRDKDGVTKIVTVEEAQQAPITPGTASEPVVRVIWSYRPEEEQLCATCGDLDC